ETWAQIKDIDWSLVSSSGNVSNWPQRLWPMEKHYHWLGRSGGYGVGYGAPASVGAALANRDLGRFSVSIQSDGDLMYAPGVLWTAAKHRIPLLAVMHHNRGYHQEVMHVQRLSNFRNRAKGRSDDAFSSHACAGSAGSRVQSARRGRRIGRERQGRLREARLLAVSRLRGAGRRDRPEARPESDAARGVRGFRALHQRRHAALSESDTVGRGPRRHPRLPSIAPEGAGLQEHSAAQPVTARRKKSL